MLLYYIHYPKIHYRYLSKPKLYWIFTNNKSPWGMKTHGNVCYRCPFCRSKCVIKGEQAQVKKGHKHGPTKGSVNKSNPKIPAKAEDWTRQPASFLFILDQGPAGDLHNITKSLRMNYELSHQLSITLPLMWIVPNGCTSN